MRMFRTTYAGRALVSSISVSTHTLSMSLCFVLTRSLLVNAPMVIVMIAFLLPMNLGASKNVPSSEVRHFRKLYLSIVTRGSNPEVILPENFQISATYPQH